VPILEIGGAPLACDDIGDGPAVLLLHAGIADRRMWTPMARRLAEHHRVVSYDLRGYGDSTPVLPAFSHHDDVVALLDALDIERAALVGCSFGGRVAIDATLAHPDRVSALCLVGSVVSGFRFTHLDEVWNALVGDVDEDDLDAQAVAEVRLWVVGPDRQPGDVDPALIAFAEQMNRRALTAEAVLDAADVGQLDPPAIHRLAEITAPTAVLAGAADLAEIRQLADRLAAGIPGARRLHDVADTAPLPPLERPEAVAEVLRAFLAGIPAHS